MIFTDYIFLIFLFALVFVYYICPVKYRWIILMFASMLFFCTWGIEMLPFVLFTVLIAWMATNAMERCYASAKDGVKARKKNKNILITSVLLILFGLVYSKTQRILAEIPVLSYVVVAGSKLYQGIGELMLKLPILSRFVKYAEEMSASSGYFFFNLIGISYYTFSLVGYIADVYWKKEKVEKNYFKLLGFTLYFPKLLQGPISKHRVIAEQINLGVRFEYDRFCYGLQRMLWGYFKKLVISDRLSILTSTVFAKPDSYQGSVLLIASVLSAVQLYADFSGYMDIALGVSEIFGIKLEENFKRPFFSRSAAEFWRRWHITLGVWFKDYVYMPITISPRLIKLSGKLRNKLGKRAGKSIMTIVPLAAVWVLTGLWHGTGWDYVIWGIYWGGIIMVSSVFAEEIKKISNFLRIDVEKPSFKLFQQVRTFLLFVIGRLITVPGDLRTTARILKKIIMNFGPWELFDGTLLSLGLDWPNWMIAVLAIYILWRVSCAQERNICVRDVIAQQNIIIRWSIYLIAIFSVLIFGIYGAGYDASTFVYMNY